MFDWKKPRGSPTLTATYVWEEKKRKSDVALYLLEKGYMDIYLFDGDLQKVTPF